MRGNAQNFQITVTPAQAEVQAITMDSRLRALLSEQSRDERIEALRHPVEERGPSENSLKSRWTPAYAGVTSFHYDESKSTSQC
jgi:hypothetical protein